MDYDSNGGDGGSGQKVNKEKKIKLVGKRKGKKRASQEFSHP